MYIYNKKITTSIGKRNLPAIKLTDDEYTNVRQHLKKNEHRPRANKKLTKGIREY